MADSIRISRAHAHQTSSHPSPRIAALRPLQLPWMLVLSSSITFTFSSPIISRSVPTHISTVKLARKEESSLSSSRLHGSSSEARSRKAENSCWGSMLDLKGYWILSCHGSAWRNALEIEAAASPEPTPSVKVRGAIWICVEQEPIWSTSCKFQGNVICCGNLCWIKHRWLSSTLKPRPFTPSFLKAVNELLDSMISKVFSNINDSMIPYLLGSQLCLSSPFASYKYNGLPII